MAFCLIEGKSFKDSQKEAEMASEAKLSALRDAAKRGSVIDQVRSNGGIRQAADTLHALIRVSNKFSRNSMETMYRAYMDNFLAPLNIALEKNGWKKLAESGLEDKAISTSMFNMSKGLDGGKGIPSEIAKIYSTVLDAVKSRQNAAGANIQDAFGYVMKTEHDGLKMRSAAGAMKTVQQAFEAWWAKTSPRLSEKTFDGVTPQMGESPLDANKAAARNIFDSLITNVHYAVGGAEDMGTVLGTHADTINVANKVASHRELIWKDGESWYAHMQDFGRSHTLFQALNAAVERGSKASSMMERLGRNPGANLNMIIQRIEESYRSIDPDGVIKFKKNIDSIKNEFAHFDGSLSIPQSMGVQRFSNALRSEEAASTMGGVGVTHAASLWATAPSELAHHGINRLDSIGGLMSSLVKGARDTELKGILTQCGAYLDSNMRNAHRLRSGTSFMDNLSTPGAISRMAGRVIDASGIHYIFDNAKAGVRGMLANNLAENLVRPWEKLDPNLSQMLGKYQITPEEWAKMQDAQMPVHNGNAYLTPAIAEELSPGMGDKLMSYYTDAANHSIVTPGVKEKALILRGTQSGTIEGEIMRFLMQFKAWPVAAMHQILDREIHMSLSSSQAAWNIGKLVALGTTSGYIRMCLQDLSSGKPLRDPSKPANLLNAVSESGALGLMGDYLFGETARMSNVSFLSAVGGPVTSDMDKLWKIRGEWVQGKAGWSDIAHFGVGYIPFANLMYLKGTLDYMLWYHLYEAANPGWWERTNRRLQKDQGRTMMGYTPGGGVPTGVPGIYMKNKAGETSGVFGGSQQ